MKLGSSSEMFIPINQSCNWSRSATSGTGAADLPFLCLLVVYPLLILASSIWARSLARCPGFSIPIFLSISSVIGSRDLIYYIIKSKSSYPPSTNVYSNYSSLILIRNDYNAGLTTLSIIGNSSTCAGSGVTIGTGATSELALTIFLIFALSSSISLS